MKRSETSIRTKRMWLRQIDETDSEAIVGLRSDERVYRFFINPVKLTLEDHVRWYKTNYIMSSSRLDWIAVDDQTGVFIGIYGVKIKAQDTVEVSYITHTDKQRQGYASEAIKGLLVWAIKHLHVQYAVANVHEENMESISFAEKMGFEHIGKEGRFLSMKLSLDEAALCDNHR